jgi:histidine triad (HIT) family protein
MSVASSSCTFCRIVSGDLPADTFFEDEFTLGLLDIAPLKPGHALLIPTVHYETIKDLPPDLIGRFFHTAQLLAKAVEVAFAADGSFSGYNTHVSQSVPHFHLHVVPRTFGDKLFSGGRWVRHPYPDRETPERLRDQLKTAMARLVSANEPPGSPATPA